MRSEIDEHGTETLTWSRTHLGTTVRMTVELPKGAYVAGALVAVHAMMPSVNQMLLAMLPLDDNLPIPVQIVEITKLQKGGS